MKRNLNVLVVLLFFIGFSSSTALYAQKIKLETETWKAGDKIKDPMRWVELGIGDIPLVISVPHGGTFRDAELEDRDCSDIGRVVKGVDSRTISTARAIEQAFVQTEGKQPYFVIAHLARRKMDPNREINLATCNDPFAEIAWENYHSSIDAALKDAIEKFGYAIFIDLHGHGHSVPRLEMGYALDKNQLQTAFKNEESILFEKSSMFNLLNVAKQGVELHDAIFGPNSLGSIFENEGFPATPSKQDVYPAKDEAFFSGGHITRKFTSTDYPKAFGLQIECNFKGVRDTKENQERFGQAFVKAYSHFVDSFIDQ